MTSQIDGTGAPARPGTSIVVEGERIVAVLPDAQADMRGARVVDLQGRHVIPGLIDTHVHLATPPDADAARKTLRRQLYSGVTAVRSKVVDAPYVDECPLVLECELQATLELGSHTQFVGRILNVGIESDCLNESGQPDMYRIDPLLYDGGQKQYCRVGEPLGKAFSLGRRYGL